MALRADPRSRPVSVIFPSVYGDVGAPRLRSRSVDDSPVFDQQIVHIPNLPMRRKSLTSLVKVAKKPKKKMPDGEK